MKTLFTMLLTLVFLTLASCKNNTKKMEKETRVKIETSAGTIVVKLYNDTPHHRDNFLKLVQTGAYNDCIFHRVVHNFMVQTGEPALRRTGVPPLADTAQYRYTLPAEIVYPQHFHKCGALAAARMPDSVNPDKASGGTQFYIVTGRVFELDELLDLQSTLYQQRIDTLAEQLSRDHLKELYVLRKSGKQAEYQALKDEITKEAERQVAQNPPLPFTEAQKQAYTTIGGAPHLDGDYTVFGEVTSGLEVAKAIGNVRTKKEHPLQEIYIKNISVEE